MNEKKSLILMVEDEEQVLNTNCRMLRRRGYDVRTAQTATEACHQLEEQLPDLLILDIMLPDGNGLDICRRFREKAMNPVLFLTGKSDIRDRVEGLQQGGDYYLTKPYNFDEFLAVIQMLLERQKRMEEKIKEKFQSSRQITIGSLRLDLSDGHAYLNNADTGLTRTEFSLLRLLAENQEKIFSTTEDSSESEKRGELHMRVGFPADDTIRESMPEKEGYFEQRSVNGGKSTAFVLKVPNSSLEDSSLKGFLAEYYPVKGEIITKKDLTFESYPATKYQYLTEVNEEEKNVDALVCQTDDYTFGLFVLTPSDTYDKAAEKEATELIKSIDFVYAERVDMAMTDYFQVLTPERWKYLCHYETTETENGGYKLTYYNEDVPVLTLEARYYDGEDQPLDSVWQGYLGRIETVDGKKYDLLSTISQYSKDASDEWKEMYDTYLDVINGIRIMDGCSLTEGSHA